MKRQKLWCKLPLSQLVALPSLNSSHPSPEPMSMTSRSDLARSQEMCILSPILSQLAAWPWAVARLLWISISLESDNRPLRSLSWSYCSSLQTKLTPWQHGGCQASLLRQTYNRQTDIYRPKSSSPARRFPSLWAEGPHEGKLRPRRINQQHTLDHLVCTLHLQLLVLVNFYRNIRWFFFLRD